MSKIFLSSPWRQLHAHRAKVTESLDRLRHAGFDVEWFGMEGFAASLQEDSLTFALRVLDTCDIYVGVLGPRYGSIPEGRSQSCTELEYEHARATKEFRALFLMDPLSQEWGLIGEEPTALKRERLTVLRARFEDDRLLNYFDSPGDLAMKVVVALLPQLTAERNRSLGAVFGALQPAHPISPASSIALTATPALINANGIDTSTIMAKVTDAAGNNVPDGEPIVFLTSGFGSANPESTTSSGGSAYTVFTPFHSRSSGRAYVTCLAPHASVTGIIAVDYVGSTP
ncbi:MAG: DUF4062 domain-containing protein [Dehalococcoidia bacterium]